MKKRILLVDDEVAILLTLKAVLEISGFDVDTAASAREAKLKLKKGSYAMVITDMRMESDAAGREVIREARQASYHPAVALLTAFPVAEEDWQDMGADKMLVKPMHTRVLLEQISLLLASHEAKLEALLELEGRNEARIADLVASASSKKKTAAKKVVKKAAKKVAAKKVVARTPAVKKSPAKKTAAKRSR